jgi:hypothetical protein
MVSHSNNFKLHMPKLKQQLYNIIIIPEEKKKKNNNNFIN